MAWARTVRAKRGTVRRENRQRRCATTWAICLLVLVYAVVGQAQKRGVTYTVKRADSFLLAITGKSGLFSFAGHQHAVLATQWSAEIQLNPSELTRSSITLIIPVSSLVIDSTDARSKAGLGSGPSAGDVQTIQQRMFSPEVLDARRYPQIRFVSTAVEAVGADRLRVTGTLEMHGHSRPVTVPIRYEHTESGGVRFSGDFTIRQTEWGMKPETVAGGTVKVKDEVTIRVQVVVVAQ